jgi:hypothetical protein
VFRSPRAPTLSVKRSGKSNMHEHADRGGQLGPVRPSPSGALPTTPPTLSMILSLQRTAGNRAVSSLVKAGAISGPRWDETDSKAIQRQSGGHPHSGGRTINPTWSPAGLYMVNYFQRVELRARDLVDMKKTALTQFANYTSAVFDESGALGLTLLKLAIGLLPLGGEVNEALSEAAEADKALKLISAAADGAEKLVEAGGDVAKEHKEEIARQSEAAKTLFRASRIESLSGLAAGLYEKIESRQDALRSFFGHDWVKYSPGTWDLEAMVKDSLGGIPPAEGFAEKLKKVGEEFELQLYKDYFVTQGRASWVTVENEYYGTTSRPGLRGVPEKVQERVKELGGERIWDGAKKVTQTQQRPPNARDTA